MGQGYVGCPPIFFLGSRYRRATVFVADVDCMDSAYVARGRERPAGCMGMGRSPVAPYTDYPCHVQDYGIQGHDRRLHLPVYDRRELQERVY